MTQAKLITGIVLKLIALIALIILALVMYTNAADSEDALKLSEEQQRFDLDGNGALSDEEQDVMLRAKNIEAFTGSTFTEAEIRDMARAAEQRRGPGGLGGRSRGGGPRPAEKIAAQFDTDKDGKLTGAERQAALDARNGGTASLIDENARRDGVASDTQTSLAAAPEGSPPLYNAQTLRTLYLRFHHEDWFEQMETFYRTDIEVPAEMIVDGEVYPEVGVHFRGTSSYFTVNSEKKSFNIAVDYGEEGQRLYGYKTLNLLNGHVDGSFLREVLYNQIARDYLPAMKSNFVKLVINGENWGIYINVQQYNKDFLDEQFGTKRGIRWKVGPGGGGALNYAGDDPAVYEETYQLKTTDVENPWEGLIALSKLLDASTPDAELVEQLPLLLNIDRALWQLAVSNVFMDDDGYIHKGGDYALYQDVNGRFHLIPHDNNESFRFGRGGRGGPGGRGPGGWSWGDDLTDGMASPVAHAENTARPLIHRLLSNPQWRAQYLAYVRTVRDEWLDWERLGPIVKAYQELIDAEVQQDDKKLYEYEDFTTDAPMEIQRFVTQRQEYLRNHPELNKPVPEIESIRLGSGSLVPNQPTRVDVTLHPAVVPDSVLLYYTTDREAPFKEIGLTKAGDSYVGEVPALPADVTFYYYVEMNAVKTHGTTAFSPARAAQQPAEVRVTFPVASDAPIVINELMAWNTETLTDPQGQHEDWLELHNRTNAAINLSGLYLTDNMDNLKKWGFPEGASLPAHGYLLIWLDEDGKADAGLHANFKLSRNGETVMLVDTTAAGTQVLDAVTFEKQEKDAALGRWPNGASGELRHLPATPGKENRKK